MKPTAGECLVVAAATVVGFALTGAVAALSLVWRATDVDLPDDCELFGELIALNGRAT